MTYDSILIPMVTLIGCGLFFFIGLFIGLDTAKITKNALKHTQAILEKTIESIGERDDIIKKKIDCSDDDFI